MKRTLFVGCMLSVCLSVAYAQNDFQNQFNEFRQATREQYVSYQDSINRVFVKHLEESWQKFQVNSPIPSPKKPLPQMDISVPEEKPENVGLQVDSIIQQKEFADELRLWDAPQSEERKEERMVLFYGSDLLFHYSWDYATSLSDLGEKNIAKVWRSIAASSYQGLISELLFYRNDMQLNDWAMFQLLNQLTETLFPKKREFQVVFATFIMNQLGFRVKIGRSNQHLVPLIAFQTTVYGVPFIDFKGERYYVWGDSSQGIYSYAIDYPNAERYVNLQIKRPIRLTLALQTNQVKVDTSHYTIHINKNLIQLFDTYPQTEISVYADSPISTLTRKSLEKELLPKLADKTEVEAVNYLLHFVQMAFGYKNDLEQFGREKYFFTEELFYYPYSDCEDRSVLFSQLVRRFLGLRVVLLDYPDHVTTAVRFNQSVSGDFVQVGGEKFVICDPTYLHASAGQSIPRYKTQKAKIYLLN